jgi:hypothetical protein
MLGSWQSLYHCILLRIGHLPLASPDRRGFITLLASSFAGSGNWAARFSCRRSVLNESADLWEDRLRELRQGLHDSGLVEGQDLSFANHRAEGRNERMAAKESDLADQQVKQYDFGCRLWGGLREMR